MSRLALFNDSRSAVFSPCRKFRYTLLRVWDAGENFVQFIGLNPSTADELTDDNTIRVCTSYARKWGFGGFMMTNLFAFRATDPRDMKKAENPVGDENDRYLRETAALAGLIVAVWGIHGTHLARDRTVREMFAGRLHCIGRSKDGHPWHPLYKSGDLIPVPFLTGAINL